MAWGKWIGGFLGLMVYGPLGALAGYALGSLLDRSTESKLRLDDGDAQNGPYDGYQTRQQADEAQRNTFRFSLLVLISYIIRADGRVMHSEMEVFRSWMRTNFGEGAVVQAEEILLKLFDQQKRLGRDQFRSAVLSSCRQLQQIMPYEQRLQLLSFLVAIAKADGVVVGEEVTALTEITLSMGLSRSDLESMLNLQDASSSLDAAYKVLGVSPSATNDELKAAYRRLALKHHPDRVAALGEDVRKAAEKKFQEINAAKETIWKARGM